MLEKLGRGWTTVTNFFKQNIQLKHFTALFGYLDAASDIADESINTAQTVAPVTQGPRNFRTLVNSTNIPNADLAPVLLLEALIYLFDGARSAYKAAFYPPKNEDKLTTILKIAGNLALGCIALIVGIAAIVLSYKMLMIMYFTLSSAEVLFATACLSLCLYDWWCARQQGNTALAKQHRAQAIKNIGRLGNSALNLTLTVLSYVPVTAIPAQLILLGKSFIITGYTYRASIYKGLTFVAYHTGLSALKNYLLHKLAPAISYTLALTEKRSALAIHIFKYSTFFFHQTPQLLNKHPLFSFATSALRQPLSSPRAITFLPQSHPAKPFKIIKNIFSTTLFLFVLPTVISPAQATDLFKARSIQTIHNIQTRKMLEEKIKENDKEESKEEFSDTPTTTNEKNRPLNTFTKPAGTPSLTLTGWQPADIANASLSFRNRNAAKTLVAVTAPPAKEETKPSFRSRL